MKTTVIMVRHGQSVANAENRFAGHSDFELTDVGREQATLAAKFYSKELHPDVIYSSDLKRAHNTALPFADIYRLPINDREGLREIYAGKWEGLPVARIAELYTDDLLTWQNDFSHARCTDGESVRELYFRIVNEVLTLIKSNPSKTLLITTHATPIRAIQAYSSGLGAERINEIKFVRNSSLNIFEYNFENEKMSCVKTDITDHLDGSLITCLPKSL